MITETQQINTIILVLPEWETRYKELSSLISPLNKFKDAVKEFNKRTLFNLPFNLELCLNPQTAIVTHVKTLLPDLVGGLPTNKEELIKTATIPNFIDLTIISSQIIELTDKYNIDLNRFYQTNKGAIELKEEAVDREKRNYSLLATNKEIKALSTQYWLLVNSLNKYEKIAKEVIGSGYSIYLKQLRDIVNQGETEYTLKPGFIQTEIINPLKHL